MSDDLRDPDHTGKGFERRCLIRCDGKRGRCREVSAMVVRLPRPTADGEPRFAIHAAERRGTNGDYEVRPGIAVGPFAYGYDGEVEVPRCSDHRGSGVAVMSWPVIRQAVDEGTSAEEGRLPTVTITDNR